MAIYRKVALERLSSPEQLDQLLQVTDPRGWLALSAFILLLLGALGWGVFGAIPTAATGEGILIRRGGVSDLVAAGAGQVEQVLVEVGDEITKGDVVARLRQEGLQRQIDDAVARRQALGDDYEALLRYAEEQKRLSQRNLSQQRANIELAAATLEREIELLEETLTSQQELLTDGLITQQTLLDTEQQLNATREKLAAQQLELSGLDLRRLEAEQTLEQQIEIRRNELRDLDLETGELRAALEESRDVLSPYSGRVLEITVDRGDVLTPGTPILSMELLSEELLAVIFVPADQGKQVRPGMEARISPSTVQREEYGYLLGEVVWVAGFPSTSRGMTRLLANEDLVTRLMEEGPPLQVDVRLERDPATPTGFRWSSSTGPDIEISSGTLASGSVIVREDRPISLVIPRIREQLGI